MREQIGAESKKQQSFFKIELRHAEERLSEKIQQGKDEMHCYFDESTLLFNEVRADTEDACARNEKKIDEFNRMSQVMQAMIG